VRIRDPVEAQNERIESSPCRQRHWRAVGSRCSRPTAAQAMMPRPRSDDALGQPLRLKPALHSTTAGAERHNTRRCGLQRRIARRVDDPITSPNSRRNRDRVWRNIFNACDFTAKHRFRLYQVITDDIGLRTDIRNVKPQRS
jgi:hypothetical protein